MKVYIKVLQVYINVYKGIKDIYRGIYKGITIFKQQS